MNDIILSSPTKLPADQNPALVYLASLPARSGQRTQAQALRVVAGVFGATDLRAVDWGLMRYQHTQAVRSKLMERYSPNSANKMLSALRGVLREAWGLGQMSADDYQRAVDLKRITGETLPAGRELNPGEIQALMQACQDDPGPAGARDAAIVGVLYSCGLRRAEVVGLDLADFGSGKLIIRGKRSKQRTAYVEGGALDALTDWLAVRGSVAGALFYAINKGGKLQPGRMSTQAVYNTLVKRGAEASVENFSPHDFRRTFISDLLDAGADIATVSKMAGHANVQTTARYDRRPEAAKQRAARLLHVPYRKRIA